MESSFPGLRSPPCNNTVQSTRPNSCYPTLSPPPTTARPGRRFGSQGLIRIRFPICNPNNGFSAATGQEAGLLQIWKLQDTIWCSSRYTLEGARIKLGDEDQQTRLARLSRSLHLFAAGQTPLPSGICLPEKDLPILLAAIAARATLTECTSDIYPVCPIVYSFLALCDCPGRKLVACPRLSFCFSR
jgi:hypothetical protein